MAPDGDGWEPEAGGELDAYLAAIERWRGGLTAAFHGAWKLLEVGAQGPPAKGRREGQNAVDLARRFLRNNPLATRRRVLELLMEFADGDESVWLNGKGGARRSTGDSVYQKARKRAERALSRGIRDAGSPPDLRRLL